MNRTKINPYLTFNGNCREAMNFYKECLGGKLVFQTVGESPVSEKMPLKMKDCILHSTLSTDAFILMASDLVSDKGLINGNAVSMMLHCNSEEEIIQYYSTLSLGGEATHPPKKSFQGSLLGDLIDKYGHQWFLYFVQTK